MSPCSIRFTHDRINNRFRNGELLDATISKIVNFEMEHTELPPLDIFYFGGRWYSISNRRLYVARCVQKLGCIALTKVHVYEINSELMQRHKCDKDLGVVLPQMVASIHHRM